MLSILRRVVFFGRPCDLSATPLAALAQAGYPVVAAIMPARAPGQQRPIRIRPASRLLLGSPPDALSAVCSAQSIPLWEVSNLAAPEVHAALTELAPELLVVSCFPWRIPASLVKLARLGGINLHPSLLPRHRGPEPLFWVFRAGERETGVTLHRLVPRLDAGEIVLQERLPVPAGIVGTELEQQSATLGAHLIPDAVERALRGGATTPQDEALATYETWPGERDLMIPRAWRVEHAWRFARGVIPLGYRPTIEVGGAPLTVMEALRFSNETEEHDDVLDGGLLDAAFADGRVLLRIDS
ncbi:MAG TPA: formyltransferase family protein [Thermomicrobiaceae bacterium]|nr:formyltransferase family protein [Thermomicrobiaceae bacterium]